MHVSYHKELSELQNRMSLVRSSFCHPELLLAVPLHLCGVKRDLANKLAWIWLVGRMTDKERKAVTMLLVFSKCSYQPGSSHGLKKRNTYLGSSHQLRNGSVPGMESNSRYRHESTGAGYAGYWLLFGLDSQTVCLQININQSTTLTNSEGLNYHNTI